MNWYILAVIPVLGLLVFVHELGHFLTAKWAGKRIIVLCAGVFMNFLLAIVLFTLAYSVGQPSFSPQPLIGAVVSGSPAEQAGLHADDLVVSVNGHKVNTFLDMSTQVMQA